MGYRLERRAGRGERGPLVENPRTVDYLRAPLHGPGVPAAFSNPSSAPGTGTRLSMAPGPHTPRAKSCGGTINRPGPSNRRDLGVHYPWDGSYLPLFGRFGGLRRGRTGLAGGRQLRTAPGPAVAGSRFIYGGCPVACTRCTDGDDPAACGGRRRSGVPPNRNP